MTQKVMREFTGLESCDKPTKDAMLNFSFYLSIGNMDDAFKAIKTIKRYLEQVFYMVFVSKESKNINMVIDSRTG